MFESQDDRRFIVQLSICQGAIYSTVLDRSGVVSSESFDINKYPETFVRVLAGIMLALQSAIGYDDSIYTEGDKCYIQVQNISYKIVKTLFISNVICGRGTACWRIRHDGKEYAIKDMWVDVSRAQSEVNILQKVADVKGVPKVLAAEDIIVEGHTDTTDRLRSLIDSKKHLLLRAVEI